MANVEFDRFQCTPPKGTVVRTVTIDGAEYQVLILAKEDGTLIDMSLMATGAKQDLLLTELQKKADITETQPVFPYYSTGATTYQIPRLDPITHDMITVEHTHHEVHDGNYYRSGMNFTLANGNVATFALTTPNTAVWAHMNWFLETSADGTFTVLEGVTSFAGGASVTPLNHNRNSLNTSDMTCLRGMTGADLITPTGGTTILNAVLSTGKGSDVSAGHGEEFILKQNSNYLFRYTNGTSANVIRFVMEWYEHESRTA